MGSDERRTQPAWPAYMHRANNDGTFDTICTTCAATVGSSKIESDLAFAERWHACTKRVVEGVQEPRERAQGA